MNITKKEILASLVFILSYISTGYSQIVDIDVNLDVNHTIDTITSFDRSKFITIHADVFEPEWDELFGENFTSDLRSDFLFGYDVYLGRNTGNYQVALNKAGQDPDRAGYPDLADLQMKGAKVLELYASRPHLHKFESRNNLILCAQLHPFWPDGKLIDSTWAMSAVDTRDKPIGSASGEYMANFIKNYFGKGGETGQPTPKYVEVINEPLWHLVDINKVNKPLEVFRFHNTVAKAVKSVNPGIKVGGFCTAFPELEMNNFNRWHERWKLFIDTAGRNMDFWSIHLYDFPAIEGQKIYRKGSNMEATFDMIEHYSYLKLNEAKSFIISEYGASSHDYTRKAWTPYRDWLHMVAVNSMMMQFMERANIIEHTINFLIIKATWGNVDAGNTYPHRLLRRADEPSSYSGEWVYTDMLKTYQLWKNVNGKRVDSWSVDPDILVDAYVEGEKAYVIVNNLVEAEKRIRINIPEEKGRRIKGLMVKDFYLEDSYPQVNQNVPRLDTLNFFGKDIPHEFVLKPEGTIIFEYTYKNIIRVNNRSDEVKYYATEYLKPIKKDENVEFFVEGVKKTGKYGEATLRIGIGREHGKSVRPVVLVNDIKIIVPHNFRGDEQKSRKSFFGVLEVNVPYSVLKSENKFELRFPDEGGYISSLSLQVFNFTNEIKRTSSTEITSISIMSQKSELPVGGGRQMKEIAIPDNNSRMAVRWESMNPEIAEVSESGWVSGISEGTAKIAVASINGFYYDTTSIEVVANVPASITVDDREKYLTTNYYSGGKIEVFVNYNAGTGNKVTGVYGGVQVMLREILPNWSGVANDYIFSDESAIGTQSGTAKITIDLTEIPATEDLPEGNFYFFYPRFNSSFGKDYGVDGLAPITILRSENDKAD